MPRPIMPVGEAFTIEVLEFVMAHFATHHLIIATETAKTTRVLGEMLARLMPEREVMTMLSGQRYLHNNWDFESKVPLDVNNCQSILPLRGHTNARLRTVIGPVGTLNTGWSTNLPNVAICCTSTLGYEEAVQFIGRVRLARNGESLPVPKLVYWWDSLAQKLQCVNSDTVETPSIMQAMASTGVPEEVE